MTVRPRPPSYGLGPLLRAALDAKRTSARAFAKDVGCHFTFVSAVIRGQSRIPIGRIDAWAAKLGLQGADLIAFLEAAWLQHTPGFIADRYISGQHKRKT